MAHTAHATTWGDSCNLAQSSFNYSIHITTDRKIKEISASFFKSSFFTVSEAGSDFELKKEEKISLMSV